jgi:hypothetical protein
MRNKKLAVFFISLISVTLLGLYVTNYADKYYSLVSYGPDPLDGLVRSEAAYYKVQSMGRLNAFLNEFKSNPRAPLVTALPALLFPEVLRSIHSHLILELPLVFLFLFLLGFYALLKSNSVLYSSSIITFYATAYGLTEPYFGIGFNMPDTIAGIAAGCAGICLLFWFDSNKIKWPIFFALFLSTAVLSRYIFCVYSFLLFSFPLILLLRKKYKESKKIAANIILPVIVTGAIILTCCGYFIFTQFKFNYDYYTLWTNPEKGTLNVNIWHSAFGFFYIFSGFLRKIHIGLLIFILFINFFLFHNSGSNFNQRISIALWSILVLPFYWILILKTNSEVVASAFMAGFPIIVAFFLLPLKDKLHVSKRKNITILSIIMIITCIADAVISIHKNSDFLSNSYPFPEAAKNFSATASGVLNDITPSDSSLKLFVFSDQFLDDKISLTSFYTHGRHIQVRPNTDTIRIFKHFWEELPQGFNNEHAVNQYYLRISKYYNVAIIFPGNKNADVVGLSDSTSRLISENVHQLLLRNHNWSCDTLDDKKIGIYYIFHKKYLMVDGEKEIDNSNTHKNVEARNKDQWTPLCARYRSASMAAMQPVPAAVTACR